MFLKPFVFTLLVLTWAKIAYLSFENVNVAVFFLQLTINNISVAIKSDVNSTSKCKFTQSVCKSTRMVY